MPNQELNKLQATSLSIKYLTERVTTQAIEYLSQWNQVGDLHRQFITALANSYAQQLLGDEPCRLIWAAHPGLGKTTCLRFFLLNVIEALRENRIPDFVRRGVLVCSNQVTELEDHVLFLRDQLGDDLPEAALYHQKQETQDFTRRIPVANEGDLRGYPILFATQNLIRRLGSNLHRKGDAKAHVQFGMVTHDSHGLRLLCWDEEAIATKASHVNIDGLREFKRRHSQSSIKQLDQFVHRVVDEVLAQVEAGHQELNGNTAFNIHVPQLDTWESKDANELLSSSRAIREFGENYIKQARQLAHWQGDSAVIHFKTNTSSNEPAAIVMDYVIEVPSILERAVVTDASAATNKLIQLDKGLKHAVFMLTYGSELKRYDSVRLYVQAMPSGRTSFLDGDQISTAWELVLMGVVPRLRQLSPPGHSLVITFKGSRTPDQYIKQIQKLVWKEDQDQLHYTTYGKHRGDNQWSHCTSVFLAGTFHRDEGELSSLARSQTRKPLVDQAQPFTTKELVHSQTASDIQQALSRGCCREVMTVGGITQAKPMNAFVGLSRRELPHVVKHLRECFPGIQIVDLASGGSLVEEELLSTNAKVQKGLMDYLSISQETKIKASSIREILQEVVGQEFSSALWSSAQKQVHVPGWIRQGHAWIRG